MRVRQVVVPNVVWSLIGQVGGVVLTFAASVYISRDTSIRDFGIVTLLTTVMTGLAVVFDTCIQLAVAIEQALTRDLLHAWRRLTYGTALLATSTFSVAGLLVPGARSAAVAMLAVGSFFLVLSLPERGLLIREQRNDFMAVADITGGFLGASSAVVFLEVGSGGLLSLCALVGGTALFRFVFLRAFSQGVAELPSESGLSLSVAWSRLRDATRGTYGYQVMTFGFRNVDNLIVRALLGVFALGLYGRAYTLILGPLIQAQSALGYVAVREFVAALRGSGNPVGSFLRYWSLLFLLILPVAVVCLQAPESIVLLLLGESWLDVSRLLGWAALAIVALAWGLPAHWVAQARRDGFAVRVSTAATAIPLIGLSLGALIGDIETAMSGFASTAPFVALTQWLVCLRDFEWRALAVRFTVFIGLGSISSCLVLSLLLDFLLPSGTVYNLSAAGVSALGGVAVGLTVKGRFRHA